MLQTESYEFKQEMGICWARRIGKKSWLECLVVEKQLIELATKQERKLDAYAAFLRGELTQDQLQEALNED